MWRNGAEKYINLATFDQYLELVVNNSNGLLNNLVVLIQLYDLIEQRKEKRPEGSYTTRLFNAGLDKIVKKLGEEAVETVIAAKNDSTERIVEETCDLLYHLLVTLVEKGVTLEEIRQELVKRRKV